jgi:hypothetical protein
MAERTWETLEQPILEAVAELEDLDSSLGLATIAAHTGLPLERVRIGVNRLFGSHLTGSEGSTFAGFNVLALRLLPKGRQVVDQWPSSDPAEVFLQALAQRIAVEDDPEVRSRLERLRDSASQVGKGVLAGISTAVVQQVTGLR